MVLGSNQSEAKLSVAHLPPDVRTFKVQHPRNISMPNVSPAATVPCSSAAPLQFKPSAVTPSTIVLKAQCLMASSTTAGASLTWATCGGADAGRQRFVFTKDGRSHGGDCANSSCDNVQLVGSAAASTKLCIEFHTAAVPCPGGGQLCLWTCNCGWLQNASWTAAGQIALAAGPHHASGGSDCVGKKAPLWKEQGWCHCRAPRCTPPEARRS